MYSEHLQFTVEKSRDNKISFLDLEVIIKNNHIITNWYRKPTFSGRLLNFHSQHPNNNKIAIIYSLVDKAIKLSDVCFHSENLSLIKQLLFNNDYPVDIVNTYIEKRLKFLNNNLKKLKVNNRPRIVLPFVEELKPVMKNFFNKFHTDIIYSTVNKFRRFIKLGKDKCKTGENTNVVYRVDCNDCDATYVGQTGRRLDIRIREHKKRCEKYDMNNALYTHISETNHSINFNKVKILDKESRLNCRLLSEMFHIHSQNKFVNKMTDTMNLNEDYKAFIHRNKI